MGRLGSGGWVGGVQVRGLGSGRTEELGVGVEAAGVGVGGIWVRLGLGRSEGWDQGLGLKGWDQGVGRVRVGGIGVREVGIGGVGVREVEIGGVGVKKVGNVINPPDLDSFDPKFPPTQLL